MKHYKFLFILAILFASMVSAQAQQRDLYLSLLDPTPTTIDSAQSFSIHISVLNTDTGIYSGRYTYAYTVNGTLYPSSTSGGIEYDTTTVTINPGDSIIDSVVVHTSGPAFFSGPSVVVIWPVRVDGDEINALDSIKFGIDVNAIETGVGDIVVGALYYNNGKIVLREAGKNELMQVRIWNANGAEMYYTEGEYAKYVELPDLPAGMYIAEAILSNNKRAILKFIKPLH